MAHITISYRRDDSGVITGRIFDRLVAHYGREAVFRDIDNIPAGVDFRLHIDRVFDASDIVLAIVGPHWVGPSEAQNRLANEADPVRIEIEGALRKGTTLIPVLVLGAHMPTPAELPEPLKDFAFRNAVQLDAGQDFDVHMARLIRAIDGILGPANAAPATPAPMPVVQTPVAAAQATRSSVGFIAGVALVIILLAAVGAVSFGVWHSKPVPQTVGDAAASAARVAAQAPSPPPVPAPPIPPPATPPRETSAPTIDADALFWQSIAQSSNRADFEEYLRQYPQGRFAGLARNRLQALSQVPVARPEIEPKAVVAAATPPSPAHCGGNADARVLQPIAQLYQAINTKDIDLYAAQWADKGVYRDLSNGTVRSRTDKVAERRAKFAQWEEVRLTMNNAAVTRRDADTATIEVFYSMMVKIYGRPPIAQSNVREDYVVACGPDGRWLIEQNIDNNASR
jgi:hypothetical protein